MRNEFIAFRVPEDVKNRLSAVASAEYLTISDICRIATIHRVKELEEKYSLRTPKPQVSKNSAWQVAAR